MAWSSARRRPVYRPGRWAYGRRYIIAWNRGSGTIFSLSAVKSDKFAIIGGSILIFSL
ncbi:hypothetical protein HMPREF3201_01137 [Megasphaera sp. MJR8396C]|nr:hypothetical protein HMPREF3201_01137 [Megasphaera sp. MJR8396C]